MACQAASHVSKKGLKCKEMVIDIPFVLEPPAWPECCIYRVPKKLRMVNKEAYTPKLITIGPLHNNYCREEFRDMEMQKLRYLREFCYRTGKSHEDLARIIEGKEVEIRHCYAETSELTSKEFVNMILLDGVFIIELFVRTFEKKEHDKKEMEKKEHEKKEYEDYLLSKPWLRDGIQHDLLLLENQLPFFVLEDLYKSGAEGQQMIKKQKDDRLKTLVLKDTHFLKLCREYFSKYDQRPNDNIDAKVKHFTDLLRYFFHPSYLKAKPKKAIDQLYSATKLDEAGVKFKKVKERHLLDIQFNKGTCLNYCPYLNCSWLLNCLPCLKCLFFLERMQPFLELPTFEVGHETDCVFRNIMALEQCHYPKEAYICNYILLLDCLINTEKDVDLLVEKKVILNQLGSHEALARLVNKLGHQIVAEDSCYFELSEKLNEHYEDFWNRNMATLTTTYFRDIWRGTATVVGIIFLLLTFWNIFLRHFVKMPRFRNN